MNFDFDRLAVEVVRRKQKLVLELIIYNCK